MLQQTRNLTSQLAPQSEFSTLALPAHQQFAAWQDSIRTLFEVRPNPSRPLSAFYASLSSTLLDQRLLISRCTTSAQTFTRTPLQIASDGMDHYLIQTHISGSQIVNLGNEALHVCPGDLLIIDLAEPHSATTTDFSHLSLVIPRPLLSPYLISPDNQHCRVLDRQNPLTRITVNHLKTLENHAKHMPVSQLGHQITPTLSLLACAMNSMADDRFTAQKHVSDQLLQEIKHFIEAHLASTLDSVVICERFNISRSTLYRLFEHKGGIRNYIRERRLRRSVEALLVATPEQRNIDIAFEHGFQSEAHFSRAIRLKYGTSPSSLRKPGSRNKLEISLSSTVNESAVGDREYEAWLHDILKTD